VLTVAQLAHRLKVTPQTVRVWTKAGLKGTRRGRTTVYQLRTVEAWLATYKDSQKTHGGKRPGAGVREGSRGGGGGGGGGGGRKKSGSGRSRPEAGASTVNADGGGGPETAAAAAEIPPEIPTTSARLDELAREGKLTRAGIAQAVEAIKLRRALREEERESGLLLNSGDVEASWARGLAALRAAIEQLPSGVCARAQQAMGLTAPQVGELRRLLQESAQNGLRVMVDAAKAALQD